MSAQTSIIRTIMFESSAGIETIRFISQTASHSLKTEQTNQGKIKKHQVEFKVSPINDENDSLMVRIRQASEFYITDYYDYETKVGSKELPPKKTIEQNTDGKAGGFRGYIIRIDWNSL